MHYATSREVLGSIPGGVTGDFFRGSLPSEPCALGLTQPLKMSTRDFSWGKGGWCVWLTTYHPRGAEASRKSGALTYLEPLGPPWPVAGWPLPNYCENMGKCKCNIIFGHVRIIGSLSGHLLYCPHPNNCVYLFWKEIMFWLIHICHTFTSIHYINIHRMGKTARSWPTV
jgi:hypothetical protein